MSFFVRNNWYVTRGSRLMFHERKLSNTLTIDGPRTTCPAIVQATLIEIRMFDLDSEQGLEHLIVGSQVGPRRSLIIGAHFAYWP